jgi:hypothetical protein
LLNGKGQNSLASHVEETRALQLGFSKEDVIIKEKHDGKSWTNISFLCLLKIVKNKYWEYNCKPFKESNWKTFKDVVNAIFLNDVVRNWKQVQDKWNKMKKIYEIEKKKTEVIGAFPSYWP